jgi:ABC-type phosphate transport system substrate-binding protein
VAAATLAASVGSALADPTSPPPVTSIVAVGSDTIEYLGNQFSTDYNKTSPTNPFYSWDATGTSPIQTKNDTDCTGIVRPNGSGAGITQLEAKVKTSVSGYYCVDLARASRNIESTDGTGIVSVLFAHDLITWSGNSGGNQPTNLSSADLKAIYLCDAQDISSSNPDAPVTWSEVGGTGSDAIVPVLPQTSSGTRKQWLIDLNGGGSAAPLTPGSCVINGTYGSGGTPIEENEGTNAVFTAAGWSGTSTPNAYKDIVFPFSGGSYVCQKAATYCPNSIGSLGLENIDGKTPLNSSGTINVSGSTPFGSVYIRGLYLVALNAGTAAKPAVPNGTNLTGYSINLTKFLGQGDKSGWICGASGTSTTAATDIVDYGFATVANCGALTGL